MAPVSGKTRSSATILTAAARFLLQDEQVNHGDFNGSLGEVRGGLYRQRRPGSVRLGFRNWGRNVRQRKKKVN
jgi:hypothetical protein